MTSCFLSATNIKILKCTTGEVEVSAICPNMSRPFDRSTGLCFRSVLLVPLKRERERMPADMFHWLIVSHNENGR